MDSYRSQPAKLGQGITAAFIFDGASLTVEWAPKPPVGRKARRVLPAYRQARHEFLTELSERLGVVIAVAEI